MAVTLAFYHGWGGGPRDKLIDATIRAATLSQYSHVELIPYAATAGGQHIAYSSSPRDGGVRARRINFRATHWDMIQIDADPAQVVAVIERRMGQGYDVLGACLSPLRLPWRLVGYDLSFCSEIVAEALDWPDPWRWSPARMARHLSKMGVPR